MQVINSTITLYGTEDERSAFPLQLSDPAGVSGYGFRWITPNGTIYESAGTNWVQTVRQGADRMFPQFASGSLQADDMHTRVHNGQGFRASIIAASVSNNNSLDVAFTTAAADYPHVVWHPALDGSADFLLYEGAGITGGTAMDAINLKRTSDRTYAGSLVHSPTVDTTGTLIWSIHMSGGSGPHAAGGPANGFDEEWILKPSTTYLARVFNRTGQSKRAGISPIWYIAPLLADA